MAIGFAVGLVLGGASVAAFAAASDYGRSMRLNAPESSRARFTGAPIYDWADAPSGWGRMNDINKINIGGKAFDVTGGRLFSPQTLAKGAVSFVRYGGPAWIGFMVAGLIWDEVSQRWLTPGEEYSEPDGISDGRAWIQPGGTGSCRSYNDNCTYSAALEARLASLQQGVTTDVKFQEHLYNSGNCLDSGNVCSVYFRFNFQHTSNPPGTRSVGEAYVSGYGEGVPAQEARPATDQELEDAIYVELVARGMGSDLARRLIEAGYQPAVDGIEIDGPSSIPGDSTTTTTSGPAGQTTSTTNTTHNITYNTNTTNNTSTVTITNTTTTTTTAPDGTTTETTEETAPEGGETTPPEEPKPFCELYPTASACAELGETQDEELGEESVDVSWAQQGGAGGACPAPIQISVLGTQHAIQWTPICQVASGIRPIVIGLAWLSAALWLFLMARARA